jgi:hypothetical protein
MASEEPFEDYEVYDILVWVEGSPFAHLQQWPTYITEWWCSEFKSHDHHKFADEGFVPISVHTERAGFLWLATQRVWTFRRTVKVRCRGVRGGPSITSRLTQATDLDGR